jgi:hypothetical protein
MRPFTPRGSQFPQTSPRFLSTHLALLPCCCAPRPRPSPSPCAVPFCRSFTPDCFYFIFVPVFGPPKNSFRSQCSCIERLTRFGVDMYVSPARKRRGTTGRHRCQQPAVVAGNVGMGGEDAAFAIRGAFAGGAARRFGHVFVAVRAAWRVREGLGSQPRARHCLDTKWGGWNDRAVVELTRFHSGDTKKNKVYFGAAGTRAQQAGARQGGRVIAVGCSCGFINPFRLVFLVFFGVFQKLLSVHDPKCPCAYLASLLMCKQKTHTNKIQADAANLPKCPCAYLASLLMCKQKTHTNKIQADAANLQQNFQTVQSSSLHQKKLIGPSGKKTHQES